MAAKWEKLEGNVGVLTIEVDAKEVNNSIDAAFKKVVKTINVPGFRKGKMPRPLFEQRFGIESLYQDALDIILPTSHIFTHIIKHSSALTVANISLLYLFFK